MVELLAIREARIRSVAVLTDQTSPLVSTRAAPTAILEAVARLMAGRCPAVVRALETSVEVAAAAAPVAKDTAVAAAGAIRAEAAGAVVEAEATAVVGVEAVAEVVEATVAAVLDSRQATACSSGLLQRLIEKLVSSGADLGRKIVTTVRMFDVYAFASVVQAINRLSGLDRFVHTSPFEISIV
jgi:hypothetical protein